MTNPNGTIFALQWDQKKTDREKGRQSVFENALAEKVPSLVKEIVSQAMEVHRSPNTRDPRKTTPRHINN